MRLKVGTTLGVYEVTAAIGAGGPASVRGCPAACELWRGLAEAKQRTRQQPCPLATLGGHGFV